MLNSFPGRVIRKLRNRQDPNCAAAPLHEGKARCVLPHVQRQHRSNGEGYPRQRRRGQQTSLPTPRTFPSNTPSCQQQQRKLQQHRQQQQQTARSPAKGSGRSSKSIVPLSATGEHFSLIHLCVHGMEVMSHTTSYVKRISPSYSAFRKRLGSFLIKLLHRRESDGRRHAYTHIQK